MNSFKGKVSIDTVIFGNNSVFSDYATITLSEINKEYRLNRVLPSDIQRITSIVFKYFRNGGQDTYNITISYVDSNGLNQTYVRDSLTVPAYSLLMNVIFGDDNIETVCSVKITGNAYLGQNDVIYNIMKVYFLFNINCVFLYRLNSPKNKVKKDLIFVTSSEVSYNRAITYKQIQLDMKKSAKDDFFNYVYLTVLNRYYYVTDMVLTNDYAQLQLQEDVLMSFDSLIRSQTAFVERSESNYEQDKVDDLVVYDYDKSYSYTALTPSVTLFSSTDSDELTRRSCVVVTVATP